MVKVSHGVQGLGLLRFRVSQAVYGLGTPHCLDVQLLLKNVSYAI